MESHALLDEILGGLKDRKRAYLARAISLVEDEWILAQELVAEAFAMGKKTPVIGITGAPGVGKSTLVNRLVEALRGAGSTVGIVAVDPSSPFSGGAILGDRVRMRSHTTDEGVFYRSLATRGYLGGLSRHTGDVITLMEAYGFDYILVETVGAGQSEVDIMKFAETVVVVLAPGLGDDVQAIKAGILEIGDVFCVNKADMPGAERTVGELRAMLDMMPESGWKPPVVSCVAETGQGLDHLVAALRSHFGYIRESGQEVSRLKRRFQATLEECVRRETSDKVMGQALSDGTLEKALDDLVQRKTDPFSCAKSLIQRYIQ